MVIEDGTGLSNAQSYVNTSFVDSYFDLRGSTYASSDADIIKAMDYIEAIYGESFKGDKLVSTQALSFPRLIDGVNTYPTAVKNAACELAYRASLGTLLIDVDQRTVKEKVGSIEVSYAEYADQKKQYPIVGALLNPYLDGSSVSHKVSRA